MEVIQTVRDMQDLADRQRQAGRRLALVPTMGALHEGHLALVRTAAERGDHVTVSIFVNPTQFVPGEDFERYPRDLEGDLGALEETGVVDVVFAPPRHELYPATKGEAETLTWVVVDRLDEHLCGRFRPGHFRGVTTVVAKLFLACKPHAAVFGLKDAQQFLILKRMTADLQFGVELVGVPTVRQEDGLALSSRNVYLTDEERAQAVVLSEAVSEARQRVLGGEQRGGVLVEAMRRRLADASFARVQYAELVDTDSLQPIDVVRPGQEVLAAVAVFFGKTRLIDNAFVRAPAPVSDIPG